MSSTGRGAGSKTYSRAVVRITKADRLWLFLRCRSLGFTFSTYVRRLVEIDTANSLIREDDQPELRQAFECGPCRGVIELTPDERAKLFHRLRAVGRDFAHYARELFQMDRSRGLIEGYRRGA